MSKPTRADDKRLGKRRVYGREVPEELRIRARQVGVVLPTRATPSLIARKLEEAPTFRLFARNPTKLEQRFHDSLLAWLKEGE